ncbi:MAG: hypothetical protein U0324_39645 [Polyangiales bacterium]
MSDEQDPPEFAYPEQPRIADPARNVWRAHANDPRQLVHRVHYELYGKVSADAPADDRPLPGFGFECGCCDPEHDINEAPFWQRVGDSFEVFTDWRMVLGVVGAGLLLAGLGAAAGAAGGAVAHGSGLSGGGGALAGGFVAGVVGALIGGVAGGAAGGDTGAGVGAAALGGFAALTGAIGGATGNAADGALAGAIAGAVVGVGAGMAGYSLAKQEATKALARIAPSWTYALNPKRTTANRAMANFRFTPIAEEEEREVEGELTQSFQTWTDVPVYQYHQYFDWNFYVKPYEGYLHTASWASVHAMPGTEGANAAPDVPEMECEWDTGAFSGPVGNASTRAHDPPGAAPESDGAMFRGVDLAWPMAGQPVWMAGRWVFDCGHGHPLRGADGRLLEEATPGHVQSQRMRLELHPVKAVASARHEGVRFTENQDFYAPGVRFMFFASRFGGYYGFERINQKDYEFIVDLPPPPDGASLRWTVEDHPSLPNCKVLVGSSQGSHGTEGVGQNTDVAGRGTRLLMRFDTAPYESVMRGKKAAIRPRVQPIPITGTAWVRDQVKVTIPLSEAAPDDDAYGVIIEFAWLDGRDLSAVRKVKRFTVTFHSVEKLDNYSHNIAGDIPISLEGSCEEWRVRYGVNGRWAQSPETELNAGGRLSLGDRQFTVYLNTDEQAPDQLTVCCHGTEHDEVEDIFREPQDRRAAKLDGVTLTHEDIFHCTDNDKRRQITRALYGIQWHSLANTSDPLGRVLEVKLAREVRPAQVHKNAIAVVEDHRLAETVEDRQRRVDYILHYDVEVAEQAVPGRRP